MGVITLTVSAATAYTVNTNINTNCLSEKEVTVVSDATDKHVYIASSGAVSPSYNVSEVVASGNLPKTYLLTIDGNNNINQDLYGEIVMVIREATATGTVLGTVRVSRYHSGESC